MQTRSLLARFQFKRHSPQKEERSLHSTLARTHFYRLPFPNRLARSREPAYDDHLPATPGRGKKAIRRWARQAMVLLGRGFLPWSLLLTGGCLPIHLCAPLGLVGAVLCAFVGYACYGFSVAIASACDQPHKPSSVELLRSLSSKARGLGRIALIPTGVAAWRSRWSSPWQASISCYTVLGCPADRGLFRRFLISRHQPIGVSCSSSWESRFFPPLA
jgi:hypothetical protein